MTEIRYARPRTALYTPAERARRDASPWTLVQGILAPIQFLAFAVSLVLVLRCLLTGEGYEAATVSIVVKTALLYTIMITGAIWEKEVFGRYLFAPAFFWEDVFSFVVIALHTAYLVALWTGSLDADRCWCWLLRPMRPTSSMQASSFTSCVWRGLTRAGGGMTVPRHRMPRCCPCCVNGASAKCSVA